MPNNQDFNELKNIKTIELTVDGWISPIFVEYAISVYGGIPSYFWRVKGTLHTFVIPVSRLDFLSKGNYAKHFQETLEDFREDYLSWSKEGFKQGWMSEYQQQFYKYIHQ
jgi:hypothetical protein